MRFIYLLATVFAATVGTSTGKESHFAVGLRQKKSQLLKRGGAQKKIIPPPKHDFGEMPLLNLSKLLHRT